MLIRNRVALALLITALVTVATLAFAGAFPTPSGTGVPIVVNGVPQAIAVNGDAGYLLTSNGTSSAPSFQPAPANFTPAGDLDGSAASQVVVGFRTRPVSTATPAVGNQYVWDGTNWSPAAVNLAGGTGYVLNALPLANLAQGSAAQIIVENAGATAPVWVTVGGDTTISASGVVTVGKVNGTTYPAGGSLTTGNYPRVTGAAAVTYSAIPAGDLPTITLTGDVTGAASGGSVASTVVSATGNSTDFFGSGGLQFTVTANEMKMGPTTSNRVRLANESTTTSDTTTWNTLATFTVPVSSLLSVELDCVAGDFLNDSGTGFQGDHSVFSLTFAASNTQPGNVVHVLTQNAMVYSTTVAALTPENPMTVLDGGPLSSTTLAAQAIIDGGVVRVQAQGPNTDPYHLRCSVEGVQQTN